MPVVKQKLKDGDQRQIHAGSKRENSKRKTEADKCRECERKLKEGDQRQINAGSIQCKDTVPKIRNKYSQK
jgi:hypothetical protein